MSNAYPVQRCITSSLAEWSAGLCCDDIPDAAVTHAEKLLLDYIAAAHAGYRVNGAFNASLLETLGQGGMEGTSSVFFSPHKTTALRACYLNAAYAHGADLDDGNKSAAGHPGAVVISALMALAEDRGASNARFIEAMVVGYEVFCRLSAACMPQMVSRGFHSTGTAGTLASAAACAKLIGLGSEGVYSAISLAASRSAGLLLVGETGQEAKPMNAAGAACAGMLAALLAEQGVTGPERPLESAKGWLHAMTDEPRLDVLLEGLGDRFSIDECYVKPWPSCRHTHSAIEAALSLRDGLGESDIEGVKVVTYGHAIELAGMYAVPKTPAEAKFSIAYAVAIALSRGHFSIADLDVASLTPEERSVAKLVKLVEDDSYERPSEGVRGARVVVRTASGGSLEREILVPKGDPENPFAMEDYVAKLADCCTRADGERAGVEEASAFAKSLLGRFARRDAAFEFPRNEEWEGVR